MATEYFQIPSSQGLLPLDSSSSSFASSVLSSSGAIASPFPSALASSSNADPWLNANMRNLSLDDWAPSLKKSNNVPPSLFEPDDIEARSWENIVPQQTPEVLKASFELRNSYEIKNPQKVPTRQFISTSSKLDAWSVIDPSVSISSPTIKNLRKSSLVPDLRNSSGLKDSQDLRSSNMSGMSMGDDEETASNRYKTELCKSFTETGVCRYGVKCQFAHGKEELRPVLRHPKYKTEICKTFHNTGTCPYGIRCRFIHTRTKEEHQVFGSSTSSFVNSEFDDEEEGEGEDILRMSAPPGFSVPHWSKSWTPTASPSVRKANLKKSVA